MFKNMLTNKYVSKMVLHGKIPLNWWWLGFFFFFFFLQFISAIVGSFLQLRSVGFVMWIVGVTHTGDGSQVVLQWWWWSSFGFWV